MDYLLNKDNSKCFVCEKYNKKLTDIHNSITIHSGTPILNIFERFVGCPTDFFLPDNGLDAKLCEICLAKINEYDFAYEKAERVRQELTALLTGQDSSMESKNFIPIDSKFSTNKAIYTDMYTKDCHSMNTIPYPKHKIDIELLRDLKSDPEDDTIGIIGSNNDIGCVTSETIITQANVREKITDNPEKVLVPKIREIEQKKTIQKKHRAKDKDVDYEKIVMKCTDESCTNKFTTKEALHHHRKETGHDYRYICADCGQMYKSMASLIVHIGMHDGNSPFECKICGKHFTQRGALLRHRPLHTGEKGYQCELCGKQFVHHTSFRMHQLVHSDIREKKCSICGMELRSTSHLNRHLKTHSGEKPHECPTCGQRFAQRYNMMTHFKAHQGIVNAPIKTCPICTMTFPRKGKLDIHLATHHNLSSPQTESHRIEKLIKSEETC